MLFGTFLVVPLLENPEGPSDWKNWTSAQEFCVEEGGTLAAIENEVEQGSDLMFNQAKVAVFTEVSIKTFLWNTNLSKPTFNYYVAGDTNFQCDLYSLYHDICKS